MVLKIAVHSPFGPKSPVEFVPLGQKKYLSGLVKKGVLHLACVLDAIPESTEAQYTDAVIGHV